VPVLPNIAGRWIDIKIGGLFSRMERFLKLSENYRFVIYFAGIIYCGVGIGWGNWMNEE